MPMGGQAKEWATPEEIDYIRGLYAGETSFVDHRFGIFYNKLKESGLLDNSIMVVFADHGHPLADHGKFLKGPDRMYNELLKVPFMVRLPGGEKHRDTDAIVQFPDFLPTMLDLVGLGNNASAVPGKSFSHVIMEGSNEHRKYSITGMYDGVDRCYRDSEWSYVLRPKGEAPELYSLADDRKERRNLAGEKPQEVKRLSESFGSHFLNHTSRILTVMGGYELSGTAHV
jgi:arylsulfatase A-like enzyme